MQWCSSGLVWEAVGEEHPYHPVVFPHSQAVAGTRGYPHLGTAEEGLEVECQVESGNRMLYQQLLEENLEGKCHNRYKVF